MSNKKEKIWAKINWGDPSWKFLACIVVLGLFLLYLMFPKG